MLRCEQNWCDMDLMMRLVKEETNKTLLKRYVSESESGSISAGRSDAKVRWTLARQGRRYPIEGEHHPHAPGSFSLRLFPRCKSCFKM